MSYLSRFIKGNNCLINSKLILNNNKNKILVINTGKAWIRTTPHVQKADDRRAMINSMPKRDDGTQGETAYEIDFGGYHKACEFPTPETPNRVFDSIAFKDLPVIHIKTTKNNTILSLCSGKGAVVLTRSCGMEGFKNCRKGTNVAAQATAIGLSHKVIKMGYKTVRVCIRGLGPGRMASIKGLQMGGINIVSITDTTPICEFPTARPPAARSL